MSQSRYLGIVSAMAALLAQPSSNSFGMARAVGRSGCSPKDWGDSAACRRMVLKNRRIRLQNGGAR